jgi:hypothetical protein
VQHKLAQQSCDGLRRAVLADARGDAASPLFLSSYRTDAIEGVPELSPSLANVAFVYDNALAGIALLACGDTASARRIADAVALAVERDAPYTDGRVRNAYRAGNHGRRQAGARRLLGRRPGTSGSPTPTR